MTDGTIDFAERVRIRRAELDAKNARINGEQPTQTKPPAEVHDPELIPDVLSERTPEDIEMDSVIETIDIIDAYRKWCGKMNPEVKGGQTEGIMISCPIPGHVDKVPSAWINTKNQTWYCGGCQVGGDAHDLAAYHFGFPVPGYKDGEKFHNLRRKMAESMGWVQQKMAGGVTVMVPPASAAPPPPPINPSFPTVQKPPPVEQMATVTNIDPVQDLLDDEDDSIFDDLPAIPWRDILPGGTFLDTYMRQTTQDDIAEDFHFWNGMLALGFALGKDVTLFDRIPVFGNLFICTLGHSGSGKSQARYHLDQLLAKALPVDHNDPFSKGVEKVSAPASAEVLIHTFQRPIVDPGNPKNVMGYAPVRGIVDFNEMSALIGRTNRVGNTMKPALMQFYDMEQQISTVSLATGKKIAEHPFASALTTTQPRALSSLLSGDDVDSGFINRWIFAGGKPKERVAIGGTEIDMSPCIDPLRTVQGWCGFGFQINWSPEAEHAFTMYYHEYLQPVKAKDDAGLLTRIDLTAKKICLLLTANLMRKEVPEFVVTHMKLIMEYIIAYYRLGGAEIGNTIEYQIRNDILRCIDHLKKASLRDINRALARKKYPQQKMVQVLDFMSKLGEIHAEATKGVGRPTVQYTRVG